MDSSFKKCLDSLNENETKIRSDALRILLKLCDNIISFPEDDKYRRIRVDNPIIEDQLIKAFGAIECLFEMGFVEDGEFFSLPREAPLSRLRYIQKALRDYGRKIEGISVKEKCNENKIEGKIGRKEHFLACIVDHFRRILIYEDPHLRNKARRIIPLEKLEIGATKRMRDLQKEIKKKNYSHESSETPTEFQLTLEDFLLVELTDWFKNEFFTWMDSPKCNICAKICKYERFEASNDSRISRTEIYKCQDCGIEAKFPRYTDPGILLKTRNGRCGEWANVFTLLCRTLNFDARIAHDETDHVWTEVWSISSNKWIHVDPCENTIDRPLMYERGWKKKLTYVIAYSKDEVQDVTWRYTRDQDSVMKRRVLCEEMDLCLFICNLNNERLNSEGYSEARKKFVTKRRLLELAEFLPAPPGTTKPGEEEDKEYEGRSSGSLAWRTSRGETEEILDVSRIWKIPRDSDTFELRYFCARDEYESSTLKGEISERRKGWKNGINSMEGGIFRKIENDWKITYLARSPNKQYARITWSFKNMEPGRFIKLFRLNAKCATFNNGIVNWKMEAFVNGDCEKPEVVINIDDCENFQSQNFDGLNRIRLIAELSGGEGENSWQHAQLFRQNLKDTDECSMIISIETAKR